MKSLIVYDNLIRIPTCQSQYYAWNTLPDALHSLDLSIYNPANFPNLDYLPMGLKRLTINSEFNGRLDYLPIGLSYLRVNSAYQYSLDYLPESLLELEICGKFDHNLHHLPHQLQILTVNLMGHEQDFDHLPASLQTLNIINQLVSSRMDHLPEGLKKLQISGVGPPNLDWLPDHLQQLKLHVDVLPALDFLPDHLHLLQIHDFGQSMPAMDHLPPCLSELIILKDSRPPQFYVLPFMDGTIEYCTSSGYCGNSLNDMPPRDVLYIDHLPLGLTSLTVQNVKSWDHLPSGLKKLSLKTIDATHSSLDYLPAQLQEFRAHNLYRPIDHLPQGLQLLDATIKVHIQVQHLPVGLKQLHIKLVDKPTRINLPSRLESATLDTISQLHLDYGHTSTLHNIIHVRPPLLIQELQISKWHSWVNPVDLPYLKRVKLQNMPIDWGKIATCLHHVHKINVTGYISYSGLKWPLYLDEFDSYKARVRIILP
jgi:hypothetical protein